MEIKDVYFLEDLSFFSGSDMLLDFVIIDENGRSDYFEGVIEWNMFEGNKTEPVLYLNGKISDGKFNIFLSKEETSKLNGEYRQVLEIKFPERTITEEGRIFIIRSL